MSIAPPFNFQKWVEEHREELSAPAANQDLFEVGDFFVQVVGGPNRRNDFHIGPRDELYYQVEGIADVLYLDEDGQRHVARLTAGDWWLLPAWVPHRPQRCANSVGIVVEPRRLDHEKDRFVWYCEACDALIHEVEMSLTDMVGQLKEMMGSFYASEQMRTCKACGAVLPAPEPYSAD